MSYRLYLDGTLMPVTPSKITLKINNRNKTVTLINGEEVNLLQGAGLSEVSFELLLPRNPYPFSLGTGRVTEYLSLLERLKIDRKPFQFVLNRDNSYYTDLTVSLESYEVSEEAGDNGDVRVNIALKQFRRYGTKTVTLIEAGRGTVTGTRSAETAPNVTEYTVKKGDCLWNIAKKYLGDGTRYKEIYALNVEKIQNPNLIYVGQVLTLPAR